MKVVTEIDADRWRAFIDSFQEVNIHQTPEMRDAWVGTKNYEPVVIGIEEEGEIKSIMLASIRKEGAGLKAAFSSRAIATGGPLSREGYVMGQMRAFDEHMSPRVLFSEIRNLWDVSTSRHAFEGIEYRFEEHLNFVHDLTRPPSEIWAGFSSSRRRRIKKAEANGIVVREGGKDDIDMFYELVSKTYEEAKVPLADRSLFESMWNVMGPRKMARLFLAEFQGENVAGRMVLMYRDVIYDWYAGGDQTAKEMNFNPYLVWHVLKWGIDNGFRRFDFGGAGKPGEEYGPGEFKRQFGGTQTNFGRFEKVYHPMKQFIGRKGYDLIRRLG